LIIARLLEPAAKLATARMLDVNSACHSLGEMLGLGRVSAKELYDTPTGWRANSASSKPRWRVGI